MYQLIPPLQILRCLALFGLAIRLCTDAFPVFSQEVQSKKIQFEHFRGKEAVADRPVEIYSHDKSVVVRVIGERFKGAVRLYDAAKSIPLGPTIELKAHRITALAIGPDNRTLAIAIGNFSNDWGEVRVWDGKSAKEVARYSISTSEGRPALGEVVRLSFSEDGRTVKIVSGPPGGK
jgi:WD40 repeat protein